MFGVITVENEKGKSRFIRRRRCRTQTCQPAVTGGAPFRLVKIYPGSKGIDWKAAERAAGCAVKSVITAPDLVLPQDTYIERFVPDTLPLLLMLNTAAKKLDRGENAKKRTLLIVDEKAVLPQYIERIVLCASKIKIVTGYPERYSAACAQLMENYGVSPVICSCVQSEERFDVCIAEKSYKYAAENYSVCDISASALECKLPEEYRRLCPEGVDLFLFACALFECSGVSSIGKLTL